MREEMNATQNKKKYEINEMVDGRGMFITRMCVLLLKMKK